ncbi:MAG: hypothetical protein K6F53_05025 [Lachnospiraceae bacterium]|nr:hypothetical protein [Lachnospiraceae bacterium]
MENRLIFVVKSVRNSLLAKYIREDGYEVLPLVECDNGPVNGVEWILFRKKGIDLKRKYNRNLTGIRGTLVIFDPLMKRRDIEWLKARNPEARIIFMYWNPVERSSVSVDELRPLGIDIRTYSKKQCEIYGIGYSSFFYCESMYRKALSEKPEIAYDVIFAGKDKGRLKRIRDYIDRNALRDINWYFYVTADHIWERFRSREYRRQISYSKLMTLENRAKAILECVPSDRADITMRVIDALVLRKKLITNAAEVRDCEWYDPENVFIAGQDDPDRLKDFLESGYREPEEALWSGYRIGNWIERNIGG